MNSLLRIIVGEQEYTANSHNAYKWIKKFLGKKGFPGLIIRRSELNLDYQSGLHSFTLEDVAFNNLAVILETVASNRQIEKVKQELTGNMIHGQVSVVKGMEEKDMEMHDYFVVKVYTKENDLWFKREEYEKILDFFQNTKVIWATITKGIVGYGKDRVVHKQRMFSFSEQMPIVIESIVASQYLKDLLDELKIIVKEGVIFTTPVNMIMDK
ncbi:DUF190 domain-containing protein [Clostridium sp. WILCCON 0269]|uniref:DUF190 domain-containing protein n=1 Tax=Candidatus Clostridium eludens TaxID=3381663 RepID=A0ABW8SH68_9CLOT